MWVDWLLTASFLGFQCRKVFLRACPDEFIDQYLDSCWYGLVQIKLHCQPVFLLRLTHPVPLRALLLFSGIELGASVFWYNMDTSNYPLVYSVWMASLHPNGAVNGIIRGDNLVT